MTKTFQGPRTPCTPTFANEKVLQLQNDCEDPKKDEDPNIDDIYCFDLHDDDVHDANHLYCDVDYFQSSVIS